MGLKITAAIIGDSGLVYNELFNLLKIHPMVTLVNIKNYRDELPVRKSDLLDGEGSAISKKNNNLVDLLFICGKSGSAKSFLNKNKLPKKIKIICLSGEFRTEATQLFEGRRFMYGLPELKKELIQKANNISLPGAMATCVTLGLLPIAHKKLLNDIYTTGIAGTTENHMIGNFGAGKKSHKINEVEVDADIVEKEIKRSLFHFSKDDNLSSIHFVPWKGEFPRGIFVTSQLKCTESLREMYYIFEKFYEDRSFIHISKEPVFLKKVLNTNNCFINLEKAGDILVIHTAIDNLMKGAAGQAIQNMNLMFGFDETLGLIESAKKQVSKK